MPAKGTATGEGPQPEGPPITAKGTANGGEPQPEGDLPAKGCQLDPGLVRRLFDKELDNQHEEALLLAQLVAYQLRLALQSDADLGFVHRVVVWANAAEQVSKQVEILCVTEASINAHFTSQRTCCESLALTRLSINQV